MRLHLQAVDAEVALMLGSMGPLRELEVMMGYSAVLSEGILVTWIEAVGRAPVPSHSRQHQGRIVQLASF